VIEGAIWAAWAIKGASPVEMVVIAALGFGAGLAGAANFVAGFRLRFTLVALAPSSPAFLFGSATLLAIASFCGRMLAYGALFRALHFVSFLVAAVLESALAGHRLLLTEGAWAEAESDFRERLGAAVAERG
jgi:hypothetical protein